MEPETNLKLKSLIKVLVNKSGQLLKTEIVKLCFLVDHELAIAGKLQSLSGVNYIRYYYGPYSEEFDTVLTEMAGKNLIQKQVVNGVTKTFYLLAETSFDDPTFGLDQDTMKAVEKVIDETRELPLSDLKDRVYQLDCVKKTDFSDEIPLSE